MNEITAAIGNLGKAIKLELNPDNTYEIVLRKEHVTTPLMQGVWDKDLIATLTAIQDNEPRLLQGYKLVVIQE